MAPDSKYAQRSLNAEPLHFSFSCLLIDYKYLERIFCSINSNNCFNILCNFVYNHLVDPLVVFLY